MRERARAGRVELGRDGEHVELLVDGVAYSSFHAERPWSGYVWDAIAATVCLVRREDPSVLLLGCGGGTALTLMRRLRPRARLMTVELDRRVLRVARRRFGLDEIGADVVEGDGCEFLERTRRRFDLVVDDMFGAGSDGLVRPVADETTHLRRMGRRLRPGGIAVTNSTSDEDPPGLDISTTSMELRKILSHIFQLWFL